MTSPAFHHLGLTCQDPIAVERWYSKYFGFQRARVIPLGDVQIVFLKAGNTYLELFSSEGEAPLPPATADGPHFPGVRHLAFVVDNVDAKLAEMGAEAKVTL